MPRRSFVEVGSWVGSWELSVPHTLLPDELDATIHSIDGRDSDPLTGRPLTISSRELSERGICPACTQLGSGGYVSFVSDLRLAFACPGCETLVWLAGA